jgi:ABC-type multidrug transport system fused ATPase/permease subunit
VIAHRLSTSERADFVGVVDGGELVELGSHDELVARGGAYAGLYETWVAGTGVSAPG